MATALATEAERLARSVRNGLADPQGAGSHDEPWRRTGALQDSIQSTASGLKAAIGTNDPAAAPQELGTTHIPPRPFLAPAAAREAEDVAHAVAQRLVGAMRGDDNLLIHISTGNVMFNGEVIGSLFDE